MRRGPPEGLAGKPQNGDCTMSFRARVVASAALATVVSLSGTNDPVSASLMLKFVNRVKKLR
jgi:hypothetical protein